jgi:hypothetical protein
MRLFILSVLSTDWLQVVVLYLLVCPLCCKSLVPACSQSRVVYCHQQCLMLRRQLTATCLGSGKDVFEMFVPGCC